MLHTIKKDLVSFQWEKSFSLTANERAKFWFGDNKSESNFILAIPFIAHCFNKLTYLFKQTNDSQYKEFRFYFLDNTIQSIYLASNVVTEIYLPTKRFLLYIKGHTSLDTNYDMMVKFLKG